ncbi:hypothetical protein [Rhodopseudomonas palustris]|uniref:hypothetical protein n=1 Tax=Rhodopseudomonas palustris TaxID=1076 RepID=UPI00059F4E6D|nr:hypothetical protein [Rhodopseudomonas palustris]
MAKFFHYKGTVYGGAIRREKSGNAIYKVTSFFLQRGGNLSDTEITLWGYQVPIANGQEVAVVYGKANNKDSGPPLFYYNYNLRKGIKFTDNIKKLNRQESGWLSYDTHVDRELDAYLKNI